MIKKILLVLFLVFFFPSFSLAVTNDFSIKTLVGNDINPPTTPVLLSAVPIASSQIDLSWSASTDDFSLGGYVLLRDGSPLATTTLTTYSDITLTPETLYSYEVYAFDNFYNISTTSNSLSTTTLALPVVPPVATTTTSSNSGQSTRTFVLRDFAISTGIYSADFKWRTDGLSSYSLRWGKTSDYDEGYIINNTYSELHQTNLTALEANTVYLYELIGYSPYGFSKVLKQGQFKTEEIKKDISPQNVLRLNAEIQNDDVLLTWQLPLSVPIASIRVVSNPFGYPVDINDGAIIYEGLGVEVKDKNVLKNYQSQYYTVFVIDVNGNVSSGAVVKVSKSSPELGDDYHPSLVPSIISSSSGTSTNKIEETVVLGFDVSNINILQNDVNSNFLTERITLSYQDSFVISIPFKSLPDHLKSIVVTLLDPTNHHRSYSFLLKINKDKTAYEATIAPLNVLGTSRIQIEIFDFEKKVIGLYRKQIDFVVSDNVFNEPEVIFPDKIVDSVKNTTSIFFAVGFMLVLFLFLLWIGKRRGEDN